MLHCDVHKRSGQSKESRGEFLHDFVGRCCAAKGGLLTLIKQQHTQTETHDYVPIYICM